MEDDILQGFLEESWENLNQLDSDIVAFEKDTENDDLLASVFRTIHTIKGTCGFIGLTRIGAVSHATENVLGKMRDRSIERTTDGISLVLEGIDGIKELMQGLEAKGEEPNIDHKELISQLEQVAEGKDASQFVGNSSQQEAEVPAQVAASVESQESSDAGIDTSALMTESGDVDFDELDRAINEAAARHREKLTEQKKEEKQEDKSQNTAATPDDNKAEKVSSRKAAPVEADARPSKKKTVADLSIRVNVNVLDRLMNLVGELVLARNQLIQLSRDDEESRYSAPITHLNRVTSDLQEGVMKTRMQPIGNAWSKLPRLVRDLARITEKQIELEMDGADTELDRTVLDAIKDPLTHMVRNSADHGVETSAERLAAGKSEKGTIHLNAYHEGGHVIICIEDDGAGINAERVLNKAITNGLVSEADAANLSDYDIHQFIFHPGLSTAEKVSSVSGRGVGMDVVRTEIERIGGTVDLLSKEGQGTTVRIKIPLTLAIISALVVKAGEQSFAIPQLGIVELVRLAADQRSRIERIHDKQVFRLRDRLLPLVKLTDVLHMDSSCEEDADVNIVVVQVGEEQFGLVVDEVFDTEEIVVKPVGLLLKDIGIYQGTTILGDGRVIMILDVTGIAADFSALNATSGNRDAHTEEEKVNVRENTSLLVFDAGHDKTMAVPLALVSRLEEFSRDKIEESSNGPIIQYRDCLLPLQSISGSFDSSQTTPQPVIVFSDGKQSMGLMVDGINDVVEEHFTIQVQSNKPGVLGTAVINGKATEVIDTQHYVERTDPDWFRNKGTTHLRLLIVNNSGFFKQMLSTSLRAEQYQTHAVESASEALSLLEDDSSFDAIIVDYDNDDAGDLTEWIHTQKQTSGIPVIGLCSRLTPPIQQKANETGCNAILEKLDIPSLSREIQSLCNQREWNQGVSA